MTTHRELTAIIEPFDSFWEGPSNSEQCYTSLFKCDKHNYLSHVPADKNSNILVISCGPGYFVDMLNRHGYNNVLGIDSFADKIELANKRGLNCKQSSAFDCLENSNESYDLIFCEQELNPLTKDEIVEFLKLANSKINPGGKLISHALNGANPITGAEALAQNFDHYNTFTEYTMKQALTHTGFKDVKVVPLHLYVFWKNPANYVLIAMSALYTFFFRVSFFMYGKTNKIFTKKIAAVCTKA